MKKKTIYLSLTLLVLIVTAYSIFYFFPGDDYKEDIITYEPVDSLTYLEQQPEPEFLYGIRIDTLTVIEDEVKVNQSVSDILKPFNIDAGKIFKLAASVKNVFDLRKINAGRKYTLPARAGSLRRGRTSHRWSR